MGERSTAQLSALSCRLITDRSERGAGISWGGGMAKGRAKTVCASCLFVSHNTTQDGKGCNVRQSGIACRHRWG